MIAIVDAGLGNLRSVEKALAYVGAKVVVTSDPQVVRKAERVVVPGQGAFGDCGRALAREAPLGRAVLHAIESGKPYLGICLGLQILFESSEEAPGCAGLGVFRGRVVRIPAGLRDPDGDGRLKVPHMGWNAVRPTSGQGGSSEELGVGVHPLLAAAAIENAKGLDVSLGDGVPFYFVHSFHAIPEKPFLVEGTARYGNLEITAAVARDNVFAVQFHPEKSQRAGLALLDAFQRWRC